MKLLNTLSVIGLWASADAFTPAMRNALSFCGASTTTKLKSGSMEFQDYGGGVEGPRKRRRRGLDDLIDPEKELSKYIQVPQPVSARSALGGKILVSGWVHNAERTDQAVFDLLNHEDAAFHFEEIVAFVNDEKVAKKRLLSRSARYSGLLDKLKFEQSGEAGGLPAVDQLSGIENWIANVEVDPENPKTSLDSIKNIGQRANDAGVKNVALLVSNSSYLSDVSGCIDAIQMLDSNAGNTKFTVVSVGSLVDTPEGSRAYEISDFGTEGGVIPQGATMSRDESYRLVTECLALESGANKALTFTEVVDTVNNTAATLIKGLREAGYTRPQEIHHMITAGVSNYTKTIDEYKQKVYEYENPDPEKVKAAKLEADKKDKERFEKSQEEFEEKKKKEIEDISRSWAKREYFRKSMGGNMGMAEEEYIQSVWDRAMFEGDLKYRMMHGQNTDERKELSEFMEKQERKQQAALKRAKEALGSVAGDGDKKAGSDKKDD
jgi:hypothetical protein